MSKCGVFLVCIFLYSYSIRIQENTDQKKLRIWTLFTQWSLQASNYNGRDSVSSNDLNPINSVNQLYRKQFVLSIDPRFQLILSRDIDGQIILESDWIRGTPDLTQPKKMNSHAPFPWWISPSKKSTISILKILLIKK